MGTNANRKMVVLPGGWKFKPIHDKCPECGCDLNKLADSSVEEVCTDKAKNRPGDTEFSLKASAEKSLAHSLLDNCIAWVVFPFAAAKKYASKRNK